MRLPRMTTRRWMIAVAVVGSLMGAGQLKRRHDYFSARHRTQAQMNEFLRNAEAFLREAARLEDGSLRPPRGHESLRDPVMIEFYKMDTLRMVRDRNPVGWASMVDYHAEMVRKYGRAASYPWLLVEPDPPEPDIVLFVDPFPIRAQAP